MWHLINHSVCVITMDSGPLHIAGTTDAWIIQVGSASDYKYVNPVRKKSRDYKYKFVEGECKIFCTSDIKYSVREWKASLRELNSASAWKISQAILADSTYPKLRAIA